MSTETRTPTLLDPVGVAALLDTILPPRRDLKARDRRDAYRLLRAAPVGVRVELPGRLLANRDRLLAWIFNGGTAGPGAPTEGE